MAAKAYLKGGKKWAEDTRPNGLKVWSSECGDFQIMQTKVDGGRFRLVAFEHEPSTQFPQAEFWMREYDSLHLAMHQAESM
jgi:hypothetical protein